MGLREMLKYVMEEYGKAYDDVWDGGKFKGQMRDFIEKDLANEFKKHINTLKYEVKASCSNGKWAQVPHLEVMDPRITKNAKYGIYVVYLFNKGTKELFLTINQGVEGVKEEIRKSIGEKKKRPKNSLEKRLKDNAIRIRNELMIDDALWQGSIETGKKDYNNGCICYIKYDLETLPDDENILKDLSVFLEIYEKYVERTLVDKVTVDKKAITKHNTENKKECIERINSFIKNKGYFYNSDVIPNLYLCLKSKPFVILAGISGTGKTKLVELFAEACGATKENGQYKLVPVRPDWSDSSDLFGHKDLQGRFVKGSIIDCVREAAGHPDKPYFLCLDEMNLARVEYYFSDFLSVIETRKWKNNKDPKAGIITDKLISKDLWMGDQNAIKEYGEKDYTIPDNLYVIGTVNMDETTFPFSKKVLDRANTIEFSEINLTPEKPSRSKVELIGVKNDFLRAEYLQLPSEESNRKCVKETCEELEVINTILAKCNSQVAYRVRDELVGYIVLAQKYDLLDRDDAMDFEIMQKILPRIQGSSIRVKETLCELYVHCFGAFVNNENEYKDEIAGKMEDHYKEKMKKIKNGEIVKKDGEHNYKKSGKKLIDMVRRYEEDGYTTYWT